MLVAGKITGVFGVSGWVKVVSYTALRASITDYQPWWIQKSDGLHQLEVDNSKKHGEGLVVHIKGTDDRDEARCWCQCDILIEKDLLPSLPSNDFYWHQLEGLSVISNSPEQQVLGIVDGLIETGANDVLIVKGNRYSIDLEERLIPYSDEYVKSIDLAEGEMHVNWDPDF
jgi:16S rRNA processing protein RimM